MSAGAGIMGLAARSSIALGAGLLAFKLGERVSEWVALGTSVENYKQQIEDARKEQDALVAAMNKQRNANASLDKTLADLTGNFQRVIEIEKQQRDQDILGTFAPGAARTKALAQSSAIATEQLRVELEKRRADSEKWANDQLALLQKERDAQFKTWQDETDVFVKNLNARLEARQRFEQQFGQGGLAGAGQTQGVREALDLQQQITKELRDLAFAKREGFVSETDTVEGLQNIRDRAEAAGQAIKDKFGGAFPAVDNAIERVRGSVADLGSQFDSARGFIDATVPTVGNLTAGLDQFRGMLAAMPAATEAANGAIASLKVQYDELSVSIGNARAQAAAFAQTMAG
jgi:hypothetical protein